MAPTGSFAAPFTSVGQALEEVEENTDIILMAGLYPPIICMAPPPGM